MKLEKKQNASKKGSKYNLLSKDNLTLCVMILLGIAVWTYLITTHTNRPDPRPGYIRNILERQLNNTDLSHINFEYYKTVSTYRIVFKSSEPILFDGEYVEYWLYTLIPGISGFAFLSVPDRRTVEPFRICPHCLTILNP